MDLNISDESLFDVDVLEEVPDGYEADTSAVAGAAGNSCSNNNQPQPQ